MLIALWTDLLQLLYVLRFNFSPPEVGLLLCFMNIPHMRKKVILPALLQSRFFRSFERMELVRLRPLLPGQQAGDHCVRAGPTKSTSFPMAFRKGIGGEQEKGRGGGNERGLQQ